MTKRLISLTILVTLLLAMMAPVPSMSLDNYSDVVLVLDSSGSMKNTAIEACKKSAIEFCTRLLSSKTKYRIALVIYESDVEKYNFTDDLNLLTSNISNMYADGGTNMNDALIAANELILSSNAASKNVVIMADGIPEHGQSQTSGRYTSNDSPHYDHANVVYTKAVSMHPGCNMYTLGFFHNITKTTQREFAVKFLKDLQNRGYYEASNAEELYKAFLDIAQTILVPPLDIKLSYKKIEDFRPSQTGNDPDYKYFTYEVTANVKNTGSIPANNVKVKLQAPLGTELPDDVGNEITHPQLNSNQSKKFTWNLYIEKKAAKSEYPYKVAAGADNAVGVEQFDTIIVPAGIASLEFEDKDRYQFTNSSNCFNKNYTLSADDEKFLRANFTNSEIKKMDFNKKFAGLCFGMSSVAILSKIGTIKPEYYAQNDEVYISDFRAPVTNTPMESLITYYQFMQDCNAYTNAIENLSDKKDLKKTEELLSTSNVPILIVISWDDTTEVVEKFLTIFPIYKRKSHAIIATGYEATTQSNSPEGLDISKYTRKINIYDVNSVTPDENRDIYYTDDYKDWIWPYYFKDYRKDFKIENVTGNPNEYNPVPLDGSKKESDKEKNKRAILTAEELTENLIISNSTGQSSSMGAKNGIEGNLDIWTYYNAMALSDDEATQSAPVNIVLPNLNDDYSIHFTNPTSDGNYMMSYENNVLCVKSDKLDRVDFSKDGKVAVSGNEGEFELSSTFNEGYYNMPWHTVSVKGKDSNKVAIDKTDKGIVLTGDNLKNVIIEGTGKNNNKTANISTDEGKILIGFNKEGSDFAFFKDKDNDGNFETDITSSILMIEKAEGFFTKLFNIIKDFFDSIANFFRNLF